MAGFLLAVILVREHGRRPGLFETSLVIEASWLRRLVALGFPAAAQVTLEVGVFAAATALAGRLTPVALAAHQVAINIAAFTFMVPLGVASAGAVRVGHAVGRGDVDAAARAVAAAQDWAADGLGALGAPAVDVASASPASAASLPAAAVAAGGGVAWAAALELALMLKEIARIPAEGVETREGATSAMFGLGPGQLMVSLDPAGDPLGDEALRLCAAAGAVTVRLPGNDEDARLAPITTLPAAAALAAQLALAAGHDVDRPAWTDAYYETARSVT
jgi:hypothetical protein